MPPFMSRDAASVEPAVLSAPPSGGAVHAALSPIGKVSRWPLKIRRRPGLLARMQRDQADDARLRLDASTSMPGISPSSRFGDLGNFGGVARRIGRGDPDERLRHVDQSRQTVVGLAGQRLALARNHVRSGPICWQGGVPSSGWPSRAASR